MPIVACGAFHPEFDFRGNTLQILTRGLTTFEHICLNVTVVNGKSLAIIGWTGDLGGPAEQLVGSFQALPKGDMANAIFYLACEELENVYFRPSWWSAQSGAAREHLLGRFSSGTPLADRTSDCLLRREHVYAAADVEAELHS